MKDIVDAVVYLTEAEQVTGEVLHVDGGSAHWQMVRDALRAINFHADLHKPKRK